MNSDTSVRTVPALHEHVRAGLSVAAATLAMAGSATGTPIASAAPSASQAPAPGRQAPPASAGPTHSASKPRATLLASGDARSRAVGQQDLHITFDDLPQGGTTGVVVTTQYPSASFSSSGAHVNYVTTQPSFQGTPPNFLCTGPAGGSIDCSGPTIVDFTSPVSGLTLNAMGVNDTGNVATIDVYDRGGRVGTVPVIGHSGGLAPEGQDLSAFVGVTRIVIGSITDGGGIGWDDFAFNETCPSSPVVVTLPAIDVSYSRFIKPWGIKYGSLPLAFASIAPGSDATCSLEATGALPVTLRLGRRFPFGPSIDVHIDSVATARLDFLAQPPSVPACDWSLVGGLKHDCVLGGSGAGLVRWHTPGFSERLAGTEVANSGPLTFYARWDTSASIASQVQGIETLLHTQLVAHLGLIDPLYMVQEPPADLVVTDADGKTTGLPIGHTAPTEGIPGSVYVSDGDGYSAVVLLGGVRSPLVAVAHGEAGSPYSIAFNEVIPSEDGVAVTGEQTASGTLGPSGRAAFCFDPDTACAPPPENPPNSPGSGSSPSNPSPPTTPAPTTPGPTSRLESSLAVARQRATVTRKGMLRVRVTCTGSPCSGTLRLTAVTKTRGKAKPVTVGVRRLSSLAVGTHRVQIRLLRTGRRLLRQRDGLSATATVTYRSGSATKTARAAVALVRSKPGAKSPRTR